MDKIYEFIKDCERIYCSTTDIKSFKDLKITANIKTDEIYCSRYNIHNDCIFNFEFNINTHFDEQIKFMRTIELFYPNMFSWRFNGESIEMLGLVLNVKENLGKLSRYRGFEGLIKTLRLRLTDVLKFRDLFTLTPDVIDNKIIVTGSINNKTNLYVVPIKPMDRKFEIFAK